jgi:ferric-dicitrate binding protein FerR (iron transport regulator)
VSDATRPPSGPPGPDEPDDAVARLVRLGGARPLASEEGRARVRGRVHDLWSETVRSDRRRRRFLLIGRIAAALAVVAGLGIWFWQKGLPPGAPAATVERVDGRVRLQDGSVAAAGRALPSGTRVATSADARVALRVNGGSSVRLDGTTEVRLDSRGVLELLRGAVYIDSGAPGPGRNPLLIHTSLGEIRDIGTQFEVRLAQDRLRVSVREGAATLTRADRTFPVAAGASLRVDRSGAMETGAVDPRGDYWTWTQAIAPPFELEGRTLHDYLAWLSRETGWTVEYSDPSIATSAMGIILHGSTAGLRPDQTPDVVLPTCGLRHRLEGGALILGRVDGPGTGGATGPGALR